MTRGIWRLAVVATIAVVAVRPSGVDAQAPRAAAAPGPDAPEMRHRMEQRLREGLWKVAKERIGLSDEQMSRLEVVTLRADMRRRALNAEDRTQRQVLRTELQGGDAANQPRVAAALDRLLQLHRQRLDILTDEQHELSDFMTPVQRARYAALQDELRHRADALRRERRMRGDGVDGPPRGR